ncbi:MAG: hypothetical protein WCA46_03875 [Actinocatenispora sp.]
MTWLGTNAGMFYIDDAPREKYCFRLVRLVNDDPVRLDDDVIATVRVPVEEHIAERWKEGMRPWALATLAGAGYGFGRYEVSMGVLDADDLCDDRYGRELVDWDGEKELVPVSP